MLNATNCYCLKIRDYEGTNEVQKMLISRELAAGR